MRCSSMWTTRVGLTRSSRREGFVLRFALSGEAGDDVRLVAVAAHVGVAHFGRRRHSATQAG